MAIDFTAPAGQVRLLCTDIDESSPIFDDEQIAAFLTLGLENVRLAAALALDVIATNEAYVLKVMTTLDVTTNGEATADALRKSATELRRQVSDGIDGGGDFDIADLVVDPHTFAERYLHEIMRQSATGSWPFDPEFGIGGLF